MSHSTTKFTGPPVRSCTGLTITNVRETFTVGQTVRVEVWTEMRDGGACSSQPHVVIERISLGNEHGMHGTTALVQFTTSDGRVHVRAARELHRVNLIGQGAE